MSIEDHTTKYDRCAARIVGLLGIETNSDTFIEIVDKVAEQIKTDIEPSDWDSDAINTVDLKKLATLALDLHFALESNIAPWDELEDERLFLQSIKQKTDLI